MDVKVEALKLLKQLFSKTNFADAKLEDGTIVSAEAFEPGQDLFIIDEAGQRFPAPDGEHTLEDGSKVVVKDGKIESIVKSEMEDGIEEEVKITEEMSIVADIEPYVEEVDEEVGQEEDQIAMLKTMCEEMMSKISAMEEQMASMKMSSDATTQVIAESIVELEENFSKIPAVEKAEIKPVDFESKFSKISKADKRDSIHDWIAKNKK